MQAAPPPARDARPLGGGDEGLWIWPGLGTLACRGRPLVPLAHAGALDMEGGSKKEGPAARLLGFPGVARSPDPRAPVGCLSGCTSPQSSQLQPNFSDGATEAQRGDGQSAHAQLQRPPWALTLRPLPLSLPRAAAGTVLGISMEEERKLPSGQEGHWEWPRQAAYLARDLRLTLR